jgi:hypothetical protein
MLNKKILAVAVATAFTTNVLADDALVDPVFPEYEVASQSLPALTDGMFGVTGTVVTTDLGFSIGNGQTKYVRYDLTNAEFATVTSVAGGVNLTSTISAGGDGETFAIFEVLAGANLTQTHDVILTSTYNTSGTAASSIQYALYETAGDAVSQTTPLSTDTGAIASVNDAMTGTFMTAGNLEATVASEFTEFSVGGTTGVMGANDVADLLCITCATGDVPFVQPDGTDFAVANLDAAAAEITFSGDFSFGTWDYGTAQWGFDVDGVLEIVAGAPVLNADGTVTVAYVASEPLSILTGSALVNKGTYTAALDGLSYTVGAAADFAATETVGAITYDTTAITIPYLTTFASYNQRVYLINSGSTDANYTTTFVSEAGVTETAGSAATGVVPAGEMVAIKASDMVTLAGKSRTSATIEIEAAVADILATSQTVNLSNGGTDTTILTVE